MSDVFVSYKAEDRPRVRPLVEALEADGVSVWWDARVGGGEAWRESIAEQLDAARCVIVVWSKRSTGPEGRFVRDEAARAQRRETYLPVTIDKVDPPLGFGEMQALSLNGWKGDRSDPRYQAVCEGVHAILRREAPAAASVRRAPRVSRRGLLVGGGVAAVAATTGGWLLLRPDSASANTLAVLPFANLSGDPAQSYFSDGMAEELRSALSALGGLQVVARTSSEMLRDADAKMAARRLDVANVITGSVRRSPTTVRVSAQLVDGANGLERWSQSYDRPFGDVLQIQSDIAASVARALQVELGSAEPTDLLIGGTRNPQAQDFLLQATALRGDDSEAGFLRTVSLADRAIALDPNYAAAHARKALFLEGWASTFAANVKQKEASQGEAMQSVNRAIAIAPRLSLSYAVLGIIHLDRLEMKKSLLAFERSDSLPGVDELTLLNYATMLGRSGRADEAIAMIHRTIRMDPLNPLSRAFQSLILFNSRRYAEAIDVARQALQMAPQNLRAKSVIGWSLVFLGRHDEALRALQAMPPEDYRRIVGEAAIAARSGRRADALGAIAGLERRYGDAAYYQYAQVYAQLDMVDRGMAALHQALTKRDPGVASIRVDPFVDPLRGDPRFARIVARVFG